jgi:uncharacterized membrane protein (UPF0127 family)
MLDRTMVRKGSLLFTLAAATWLLAASCERSDELRPGVPALPDGGKDFDVFPSGTPASELVPAIERGLRTRGKAAPAGKEMAAGVDSVWFLVVRDGARHVPHYRHVGYHAVIGAGVTLPVGALRVRHDWGTAGEIDGNNEEAQTKGIALVVEPGARTPYAPEIVAAACAFTGALASRSHLHPECVLAMEDVPFTNAHERGVDEVALVSAVRAQIPVPTPDGTLRIDTADGPVPVAYERRTTTNGIQVGMMMRRRFDGPNHGMLFEYPVPDYHHFWMRNCPMPIDVAYVRNGCTDQIERMEPGAGLRGSELPRHSSRAAIRLALEVPGGWFGEHGIKVGDSVVFE